MATQVKQPERVELAHIKGLNNSQYDRCKAQARQRITDKAGDKPERKQFTRQLEPLWSVLDLFALLAGLAALLVSSAHILTHTGAAAAGSYAAIDQSAYAGDLWDRLTYGRAHQAGFIILAEASMLLFMVMHSARQRRPRRRDESAAAYALTTGLSVPLVLALLSAGFVFYANALSGVGLLESVLPPAVTIGLGIYFEGKLAKQLDRQRQVTARYLEAQARWEAAQNDIEAHPDYLPYLRQEIAEYLLRLSPQKYFDDVPIGVVKQAVRRELYRDTWAYEDDTQAARPMHGDVAANPTPAAAQPSAEAPHMVARPMHGDVMTTATSNGNGQH